jgi:lipoyl-dependent peroxiredoxin
MASITRKAGVIWNGDSRSGSGMVSTESRVLYEQPYTYATRFENAAGTNPEELIAAAHAACFSMALASTLKKNGFTAKQIETNAECTIESGDGGYEFKHMLLHTRCQVPGVDNTTFQRLAGEAEKGCPVGKLLEKGMKVDLKAELIEA